MTKEQKDRSFAKEYSELKAQIKPLEDRVKDLKKYFDTFTGKNTTDLGTWVLEYRSRFTDKVDLDRLFKEHPEINPADYTEVVETKALYVVPKA